VVLINGGVNGAAAPTSRAPADARAALRDESGSGAPATLADVDRRTFLQTIGALAAGGACAPDVAPFDDVPRPPLPALLPRDEDTARFPLGVQSGGLGPSEIKLWSFAVADAAHEAWIWRVDDDGALETTRVDVAADAHGVLRLDAQDLRAGTEYFYAFATTDGRARSVVGRFVTAPTDDQAPPLVLACATCTTWRHQPWTALERMATLDFDVLLHLGDMLYADAAKDADAYRRLWRRALADPGYRALLPRAAKIHAWDDHEFWNNPDPEEDPARIAIARAAFFENTCAHEGPDGRLWRSYRFGATAEILLLDARTERRPSTIGGDDVYLSQEQLDFVQERLRGSEARFKIVMNSLPITRMPDLYPGGEDRWQGYRRQRDQLLEVLEDDDAARGVVFLGGDFHIGFVGHAEPDGVHRRLVEIGVGPSGNTDNPFSGPLRDVGLPASQFDFVTGRKCATTIALDPAAGEARVQFVDGETGAVLFDATLTPGEK
jgi:alkaline phosphatase D